MRLICPNCGAQYAVDDRVIPEAGRDVQCSSCGNTWFQKHPDHDPDLASELGYALPGSLTGTASEPPPPPRQPSGMEDVSTNETTSAPDPAPEAQGEDEPEPEVEIEAERAEEPEIGIPSETSSETDVEATDTLPDPTDTMSDWPTPEETFEQPALEADEMPQRRKVDATALAVLREEAEREQAARRSEAAVPQVQTELDIPAPSEAPNRGTAEYAFDAPPAPTAPAPDVISEGLATVPLPEEETLRPAPRRDRLPDVEEITSTLEPTIGAEGEDGAPRTTAAKERKRGSRIGMGAAFLIFGALTLLYTKADLVVQSVPSAAEPITSYVESVDSTRLWLDQKLRTFVEGDNDMPGSDGS